jgi:hypothetical protein
MSTITGFSGNDIVTGQTNGAALCFGDSGGPAWLEVRRGDRLVRYNISQNSKGDIARTSYLARWDSTTAQSFARSFIQNNGNIEICGINRQCGGPPPEPDPEPEPGPDPGPAPDPQGRKFTLDGRTVFVAVTVKDATLALDYVRQMFQNLVSFLDD